jgi:hypothetical protein
MPPKKFSKKNVGRTSTGTRSQTRSATSAKVSTSKEVDILPAAKSVITPEKNAVAAKLAEVETNGYVVIVPDDGSRAFLSSSDMETINFVNGLSCGYDMIPSYSMVEALGILQSKIAASTTKMKPITDNLVEGGSHNGVTATDGTVGEKDIDIESVGLVAAAGGVGSGGAVSNSNSVGGTGISDTGGYGVVGASGPVVDSNKGIGGFSQSSSSAGVGQGVGGGSGGLGGNGSSIGAGQAVGSAGSSGGANGVAVDAGGIKRAMSKLERRDMMRKRLKMAGGKGTGSLRLYFFEAMHSGQKEIVVAFDVTDGKGLVPWQYKADNMPSVVSCVAPDIPGLGGNFYSSLSTGKVRSIPLGKNEARKNEKNYDVDIVLGFFPISVFIPDLDDEMSVVGRAIKEMFDNSDFQEFYIASLEVNYAGLVPYLKKDGSLWKTVKEATIDLKRKGSLDSLFMDTTIFHIMARLTNGKDPSDWSEIERRFAYHNGEIPDSFHHM